MARPVENDKRVSAYIPNDTFEALKVLAKEKGMTVSGFIRMMAIEITNGASKYRIVEVDEFSDAFDAMEES